MSRRYVQVIDGDEVPLTSEEITALEAKDAADTDEFMRRHIRQVRDAKLAATDWTQVPDAPVSASDWTAYRQALRDITDHANFPNITDEDWPVEP